ncbi:MAG: ribonuclease activity regulator RraA [Candidatus Dormibacteraeota bacterium]|nr:ribonuclease activity regulator RraA [Candidatus Dormibacteraeota bacterium]
METTLRERTRELLREVSTATLTSQLHHHGVTNCLVRGVQPLRPDLRLVGQAFTLRYVPVRGERDQGHRIDNTTNPQRVAVERVGPGEVLVIDARGELDAASFGHIIATRIARRGAAGLVTDGALRDTAGFRTLDLPSYCRASHPTASQQRHHAVDLQVPIACGGVRVEPGDVVVGDQDGVVVFPLELADQVAEAGHAQERLEEYLWSRVDAGESILGVYPPSEETMAAWRARQ